MCGRFSQTLPIQDPLSILQVEDAEESFPPRYNIAPTQDILILRAKEGRRELPSVRWGLVPSWSKEPPSGDQASALLVPYEGDDLLLTPANPVMNSGAVEGPECLRGPQGELF